MVVAQEDDKNLSLFLSRFLWFCEWSCRKSVKEWGEIGQSFLSEFEKAATTTNPAIILKKNIATKVAARHLTDLASRRGVWTLPNCTRNIRKVPIIRH